MIVEFSSDLREQKIFADSSDVLLGRLSDRTSTRERLCATIREPRLYTDTASLSTLPSTERDAAVALQWSANRETRFAGVSHRIDRCRFPGAWGPTIDTLLFCRLLEDIDIGKGVARAADIGCGTGFVGQWLLKSYRSLRRLEFFEVLPDCANCARVIIADERADFHIGDARVLMGGPRFELIVSNPPYIPFASPSQSNSPFLGTALLDHLVSSAHRHLTPDGKMLLMHSVANRLPTNPRVSVRELWRKTIPFKVIAVLLDEHWLRELTESGYVHWSVGEDYPFWHEIVVSEITLA